MIDLKYWDIEKKFCLKNSHSPQDMLFCVNRSTLSFMIILVSGLPGSGKSYFAKKLSAQLGAHYLSSDKVRKQGMGSKYNIDDKLVVYEQMAHAAENILNDGHDLILDATFYLKSVRRIFYDLAQRHNKSCIIIYIFAEEDLIKERVSKPRPDSDADFGIYLKIKGEFEPISRPHLVLQSTDSNIGEMVEKALLFIEESYDRK